jgi:hypothetical protein
MEMPWHRRVPETKGGRDIADPVPLIVHYIKIIDVMLDIHGFQCNRGCASLELSLREAQAANGALPHASTAGGIREAEKSMCWA